MRNGIIHYRTVQRYNASTETDYFCMTKNFNCDVKGIPKHIYSLTVCFEVLQLIKIVFCSSLLRNFIPCELKFIFKCLSKENERFT